MNQPDDLNRARFRQRCTFCREHDMATDTPVGPMCGAIAVEELHWRDGRISNACKDHGVAALDRDARTLLLTVKRIL